MKRKVIQLAGKTHVISLPSSWVKQYKIIKGQELDVIPQGKTIIITASGDLGESTKHLDISGFSRSLIRRCLGALYKAGFDKFEVRFTNPREYADSQEVVYEEFLGFEIVNQEKNSFSVRQLSYVQPEELPIVVRRIFLIIQGMADESLEAITKKDKQWLSSISLRDLSVNKLADFCRRILNKQGLSEQRKVAPFYFIIETLEKIGDVYRDYAQLSSEELPKDKNLLLLHKKINSFYQHFYHLFYNFQLADVDRFITEKNILEKEFDKYLHTTKNSQQAILLYTLINMIYDLNGPLMAYQL